MIYYTAWLINRNNGQKIVELPHVYETEQLCASQLYENFIKVIGNNDTRQYNISSFNDVKNMIGDNFIICVKKLNT